MIRTLHWLTLACVLACGATVAAQDDDSNTVAAIERAVVSAVEKAEPSVVAIARVPKPVEGELDVTTLLRRFPALARNPTDPGFVPSEYAAGVVIDAGGFIVTTYHALGNVGESNYYIWSQRKPYRAKVVAATPWYDVAVLKVEAELAAIELGNAASLKKGSFVVALGNPFGTARDGAAGASWGRVSNLHRTAPQVESRSRPADGRESLHHYGTLIQTDARLDDGFSGGALLDLEGKLVGLLTSYAATARHRAVAGFAIPVDDTFRRVVDELKAGRVPEFGFLGVESESLPLDRRQQGDTGAAVQVVIDGSPGALAGLLPSDVLTRINGRPVVDHHGLIRQIASLPAGSKITMHVLRSTGDQQDALELTATLQKKLVRTLRPSVATARRPAWRGLTVDYSSVDPAFHAPGNRSLAAGVYVAHVDEESTAWQAGMRAGDHVTHVGDFATPRPATFRERVSGVADHIALRVVDATGNVSLRTISP